MLLNLKIRFLAYGYLTLLLIGSLIPLTPVSYTLNDNYTLNIRWDYLLHALVYLALPWMLCQTGRAGPGSAHREGRGLT